MARQLDATAGDIEGNEATSDPTSSRLGPGADAVLDTASSSTSSTTTGSRRRVWPRGWLQFDMSSPAHAKIVIVKKRQGAEIVIVKKRGPRR